MCVHVRVCVGGGVVWIAGLGLAQAWELHESAVAINVMDKLDVSVARLKHVTHLYAHLSFQLISRSENMQCSSKAPNLEAFLTSSCLCLNQ